MAATDGVESAAVPPAEPASGAFFANDPGFDGSTDGTDMLKEPTDGSVSESGRPARSGQRTKTEAVLLSRRVKAVRPEVANCLSFIGVYSKLLYANDRSLLRAVMLATGAFIILIDIYFIRCQWNLQPTHAIPVLATRTIAAGHRKLLAKAKSDLSSSSPSMMLPLTGSGNDDGAAASPASSFFFRWNQRMNMDVLDDLLSDLPQSLWVVVYLIEFDFSMIALLCAVHSAFSVAEGLVRLRSE